MKNILALLTALTAFSSTYAQQLPPNTCGIVNVYDAAGNRTKRVYFCNNGVDPYPARMRPVDDTRLLKDSTLTSFQPVEALYPNPTSGTFYIVMSRPLDRAGVLLTDGAGKVFQQRTVSGNKVEFDLSGLPAGVYYVIIQDRGATIRKKVVKM